MFGLFTQSSGPSNVALVVLKGRSVTLPMGFAFWQLLFDPLGGGADYRTADPVVLRSGILAGDPQGKIESPYVMNVTVGPVEAQAGKSGTVPQADPVAVHRDVQGSCQHDWAKPET